MHQPLHVRASQRNPELRPLVGAGRLPHLRPCPLRPVPAPCSFPRARRALTRSAPALHDPPSSPSSHPPLIDSFTRTCRRRGVAPRTREHGLLTASLDHRFATGSGPLTSQ